MNKLLINQKMIDLEASEIRYRKPFTVQTLREDWDAVSGEWSVSGGWLTGTHPDNGVGMLYSKAHYPGDNLLEFEARTVPPCANDINFTWNSQGWDDARQDFGISYIAGMGGWWDNKVGVEHFPTCDVWAGTPLCPVKTGHIYRIQAGSIGGHCFIFIDGRLVIELFDPHPMDTAIYNKVGFGTYASHVQYRDFTLRKITWGPRVQRYENETYVQQR